MTLPMIFMQPVLGEFCVTLALQATIESDGVAIQRVKLLI